MQIHESNVDYGGEGHAQVGSFIDKGGRDALRWSATQLLEASLRPPVRLPRLSAKTSDPNERVYGPSTALKRTPQLPAVTVYQFKAVTRTDASHHP
jgi:hypothetical protein